MDKILIAVIAIAAVFCIGVLVYVFMKRRHGCCEADSAGGKRVRVKDKNPAHYPYCVRLTVSGMTCQKCRLRVENALNAKGNIWASVDLKDGSAVVRMKNKLPDGTLERIVSREGFVVVGIERIR